MLARSLVAALAVCALIPATSAAAVHTVAPGQAPTPPVNAAPSAGSGGGGYRVVAGDSLSAIAARHGVPLSALAAANGLKTDSWVIEGTSLRVPAAGSAPVAQAASQP